MELGPAIQTCMEDYGVSGKQGDEWPNNMLSKQTVRGPSGVLGVPGKVNGAPDSRELEVCARLAAAAAAVAPDLQTGMGSEGGETFQPFFVARHDGWKCDALHAGQLRAMFGEALFPDAKITVEALEEGTKWWKKVEEDCEGYGDPDSEARGSTAPWKRLLSWFRGQKEFAELAFVAVDKNEEGMRGGCVFPRLLIGRTAGGSVAGLFGVVVYS